MNNVLFAVETSDPGVITVVRYSFNGVKSIAEDWAKIICRTGSSGIYLLTVDTKTGDQFINGEKLSLQVVDETNEPMGPDEDKAVRLYIEDPRRNQGMICTFSCYPSNCAILRAIESYKSIFEIGVF